MELKTQDKFRNDYFAFNIHEQDLRDEGRAEGRELQRLEDEKIISKFASENAKYSSENERLKAEIARLLKNQK